jgi:Flp pilus assembly protein TadB/Mg-chelatase subunit ChlD
MRSCALLLLAFAALALIPPGSAQADALELAPAGKPRFPERAFSLTLPAARGLEERQVAVRENGSPVSGLSVLPASAAGGSHLGVILAIDISTSMRGKAIQGAMDAALTFSARRNPDQRLGIVTFARESSTLLAPTSDAAKIDGSLARPPELEPGTRVFDAVRASITALERSAISGGSIVVLSDGNDVNSATTAAEVAAAARDAGVRVYAVGLRSRDFDPASLKELSSLTQGSYSEADSAGQLRRIYDQLGTQLASQYLVRYRSPAGPREPVLVTASVSGFGTASSRYTAPALKVPPVAPFRRSLGETFWRSKVAVAAVSVAVTSLVFFALFALLGPRGRRRSLVRRLQAFGTSAPERDGAAITAVTDRVLGQTERSLERASWWPALKEEIEVARIPVMPVQLAALTGLGTVIAVWLVVQLTGNLFAGLLGLATPFAVRALIRYRLTRERNRFGDQLADHLQVVGSALRAGHSFVGALAISNEDAPEPTRTEFEGAVKKERLGMPIEDALDTLTDRMASPDISHVALAAKLQRETGSNAAEVLDRVTGTIRQRGELRRHIRALTAQQRMARGVLTALPILLLVALALLNPDYLDPLFEESMGRVMLTVAALLMLLGSWLLKRLVEIKV